MDEEEALGFVIVAGLVLGGFLVMAQAAGNWLQVPENQAFLRGIAPIIPSLIVGAVIYRFGFFMGRRSSNETHIREEARLMIFEKNATQMAGAELWQVVKDKGESSRDGVIAMNELKRRNNPFAESVPVRLETDAESIDQEQPEHNNGWRAKKH